MCSRQVCLPTGLQAEGELTLAPRLLSQPGPYCGIVDSSDQLVWWEAYADLSTGAREIDMTETYDAVRHTDILRRAFRRFVAEDKIAETEWPQRAMEMVWSLTGKDHVDPALLDWIVRQ